MSYDLDITTDDYFTRTQPAKSDELRNSIAVTTQPLVAAVSADIYTSEEMNYEPHETKSIEVKYSAVPVKGGSVSLVSYDYPEITINDADYYAWGASITITNDSSHENKIKFKITAIQLSVSGEEIATAEDADSIRENGLLKYEFPKNHLIQTAVIAQAIADDLLSSYKTYRKDVSLQWRGNPALELGDTIRAPEYIKNGITERGEFDVYKNQLEFVDGLTSNTEGRKT